MKILINSENIIIATGEIVEFGIFDEEFKKWKIQTEENFFYLIDYKFKSVEVTDKPNDTLEYKYSYTTDKGFYLNPNYVEPINEEEEVKRLKQENSNLKAQLDNVQEVLDYLVMQ